jgi:DNA-directed RNA polymerase sigma subunit (sigma70/sigma32)
MIFNLNDAVEYMFANIKTKSEYDKRYLKRNIEIVRHRYGFYDGYAKPLKKIAKQFRVSPARVRQVESDIFKRCRSFKEIKEFL